MIFTGGERAYLSNQGLGRLATLAPDRSPQIQPVAIWFDPENETVRIGGPELTKSRKYKNVLADPRVSLVIDDQSATPNAIGQTGRGIELRGHAEILFLDPPLHPAFDHETLCIRPHRVIAWNLEPISDPSFESGSHLQGYNSRNI
ncbi:PPOX class F420-dependent oxidoreductase [Nonomuraea sp. NPDC051191]|uniref:PPOX class F420-dependent oxidoreductase n=1 Tax=Nonomuraea sp. NPDC051191 TaxID=3364372 RepID=UPI0037AB7DC8